MKHFQDFKATSLRMDRTYPILSQMLYERNSCARNNISALFEFSSYKIDRCQTMVGWFTYIRPIQRFYSQNTARGHVERINCQLQIGCY